MKETLSSKIWITMHDNESIYAKDVRGFIQKYIQVFGDTCNMRNNTEDKIREAIIYAIEQFKQEAGEELINHSPQSKTEKLMSGVHNHSEDTRKGCGKWFDTPNSQTQSEEKCGEHELCPACSKKWKCLVCNEEVNDNEMCKCMRDYKKEKEEKIQFIKSDLFSLLKVAKELKKG